MRNFYFYLAAAIVGLFIGIGSSLVAFALIMLFDVPPAAAFIIALGTCLLSSIVIAAIRLSDDDDDPMR